MRSAVDHGSSRLATETRFQVESILSVDEKIAAMLMSPGRQEDAPLRVSSIAA
jgi:hypothetical protein